MTTHEKTLKLGKEGPQVFRLGLGCMGLSGTYGATEDSESIATIHTAIDRGITLLDTGDFYGIGHNELLIGRALTGHRRDRVQLSVKFGVLRGPDGAWLGLDTRPAAVKNFAAHSLRRLGVDVIDIYRPSRLDPNVPIEETIGAIADLVRAGYVRHIGLSEVGVETIRRAHRTHPIVDVQLEYSLVSRGPERTIFPELATLGISATLYGILSRGLLTGSKPTGPMDFRTYLPRFSSDNRGKNDRALSPLQDFAGDRGMTPVQLAFAWAMAKQPRLVPLIGAKTRAQLEDALGALEKPLSAGDIAELERLVSPESILGTRYGAEQMAHLDSER